MIAQEKEGLGISWWLHEKWTRSDWLDSSSAPCRWGDRKVRTEDCGLRILAVVGVLRVLRVLVLVLVLIPGVLGSLGR